jgi:hypothetical protein
MTTVTTVGQLYSHDQCSARGHAACSYESRQIRQLWATGPQMHNDATACFHLRIRTQHVVSGRRWWPRNLMSRSSFGAYGPSSVLSLPPLSLPATPPTSVHSTLRHMVCKLCPTTAIAGSCLINYTPRWLRLLSTSQPTFFSLSRQYSLTMQIVATLACLVTSSTAVHALYTPGTAVTAGGKVGLAWSNGSWDPSITNFVTSHVK